MIEKDIDKTINCLRELQEKRAELLLQKDFYNHRKNLGIIKGSLLAVDLYGVINLFVNNCYDNNFKNLIGIGITSLFAFLLARSLSKSSGDIRIVENKLYSAKKDVLELVQNLDELFNDETCTRRVLNFKTTGIIKRLDLSKVENSIFFNKYNPMIEEMNNDYNAFIKKLELQ